VAQVGSRIRLLDDETVNKIAAGEVIERPASVVKELVENSLDAGASSVWVSVDGGGKSLVSVRDDGVGMSREDVEAAFQRHATSKLSAIDDLQSLKSYGFRGEALSSIAAVSSVTVRTRERGAREGTEARVVGGRVGQISSIGCPEGTEVVVEDLFSNLPARRKALKSDAVELGHCRETVMSYMLCRPDRSYLFEANRVPEFSHVPAEGVGGALAVAFGSKAADAMLHSVLETEGLRAESHLSRLEHTRGSGSDIRIFVNDRPVKSPRIVSAIVEGYGSRLMKDRYPLGMVRVFVDPARVDVNVHPTKREVRFADDGAVAEVVKECVRSSFERSDLSFKYDLTHFAGRFEPSPGSAGIPGIGTVQMILEVDDGAGSTKPSTPIAPLAQIMNTYILAEGQGGLLLIDQHAASERVVYEKLLRAADSGKEISQWLVSPAVLDLTPVERRVLEESGESLARLGFVLEPFGGGSYALRSVPTVLGVAQGEPALRNILDDLARTAPEKRLGLEVIWRVACHTAIRAGEPLSNAQMRELISSLLKTENPYTCEHGRPTMIVLTPADLEKLFKRRV